MANKHGYTGAEVADAEMDGFRPTAAFVGLMPRAPS